jgi:tight adherence protein B
VSGRAIAAVLAVVLAALAARLATGPAAEIRLAALAGRRPTPAADRLRAVVVAAGGRVGFGPSSRRRRARERGRTIEALGALAAELSSGLPPTVALFRAAGDPPVWPSAAAAVRMGGDVADGLRADARRRPVLGQLAACWQVAAQTGSGLAVSVEQLARSARRAEQVRGELEGQLAAPRATARVLTALPLVGIGFGMLLGADPVGWLVGSAVGRLCLGAGALLTVAGAVWTGRIAARVERML